MLQTRLVTVSSDAIGVVRSSGTSRGAAAVLAEVTTAAAPAAATITPAVAEAVARAAAVAEAEEEPAAAAAKGGTPCLTGRALPWQSTAQRSLRVLGTQPRAWAYICEHNTSTDFDAELQRVRAHSRVTGAVHKQKNE